MSRRYFEEEMRYLHEAGKVFAEAHPEQGRYLNIDSVADRDPYVERLFEGFAFLTGRIREALDDELPQYTESLCQILYPHLLRPFPSCSIVEFQPKSGDIQGTTVIKRGTEVRSQPAGPERVTCRFRTTQDVKLQPLQLKDVSLKWSPDGTSSAVFKFQLTGSSDLQGLDLDALRVHFNASPPIASLMYLFFTRYVTKVVISEARPAALAALDASLAGGVFGQQPVTLTGQEWVKPGGMAADEGLLPYSAHTFSGFRLLQEFFAYRRKFWCVDLCGLNRYRSPLSQGMLQVEVFFSQSYPEDKRFKTENLLLYCSPVVNLFQADAEPIRIAHHLSEYRVIPSARHRKGVEVYEIEHGVGLEERTGKRRRYFPFYSFLHAREKDHGYFTTIFRLGSSDRYESYISLEQADPVEQKLSTESLSLSLVCTNGSLPREALRERMINQLAPEVPKVAQPVNINQPTLILYPPRDRRRDFYWNLISHWSLNFQSIATRSALTSLMSLYDWAESDANRRRIAGIREVAWKPKELMYRGSIIRGAEVTIEIQEGYFSDEGDVCLFGVVMSEFLSMYATINSFIHLTITLIPSGKQFTWHSKNGTQPLI